SGLYDTQPSNLPGARKSGAPERQDRRDGGAGIDPAAALDPTSAAVAELASRGPARATVAAAEQDSKAPAVAENAGAPARSGRTDPPRSGQSEGQGDSGTSPAASTRQAP